MTEASSQQTDRARFFRQLHQPGNPFILANVWDVGSAKMALAAGAQALATSSAAHAFTIGLSDLGHASRDAMLSHAADIVEVAGAVPVSADCENGYGHSPDDAAETARRAVAAGLAGCSLEDIMLPALSPYPIETATARIRAAVEAVRQCSDEFVLTARADGMMHGQYGPDEALRRLQSFEEAGADVLYAPMPPDMRALEKICESVSAPVNALATGKFCRSTLADFARAGVARISLGSALAGVATAAASAALKKMFSEGDFSPLSAAKNAPAILPDSGIKI